MSKNKSDKKTNKVKNLLRIVLAVAIIGILVFGWVKGYIGVDEDGRFFLLRNPLENAVNTAQNTEGPDIGNVSDPQSDPKTDPPDEPQNNTQNSPQYYTSDVLDSLKNTGIFNSTAIEHIFLGTVNSSKKGSGYHYNMIEDTPGVIVEGTRSEEDEHGLYKANIEVDGHPKVHYSTFFPDSWSPQEVVDAINAARQDALDNGRNPRDTTWVGYYEGIEIDMYLNGKNKIISAYPIYAGDRGAMG